MTLKPQDHVISMISQLPKVIHYTKFERFEHLCLRYAADKQTDSNILPMLNDADGVGNGTEKLDPSSNCLTD